MLSLYRGSTPALASVVTENAVLFTANNLIKKGFLAMGASDELSLGQHALAGGLAGVFSSTAICPAEVVKCTLQAQMAVQRQVAHSKAQAPMSRPPTNGLNLNPVYAFHTAAAAADSVVAIPKPSPVAVMRTIFKTEGLAGFFKGLPSLWARDIPFNFAFLGSYETYLSLFAYRAGCSRNELDAGALFVSGGLAGMTGWSVVFPFDTLKSRIQSAPAGQTAVNVALQIFRHEGVRAFYNGWSAAVMRAFPANAALLLGFELSYRLFDISVELD